jgi:polyphosphate kinase
VPPDPPAPDSTATTRALTKSLGRTDKSDIEAAANILAEPAVDHDWHGRLDGPSRFLNRELSWLDFNARVLELAETPDMPLLERTKFFAIFASNLDEFYMVRVAGLQRQVEAGLTTKSADGLTPQEQLIAIAAKAEPLIQLHAKLFCEEIMPALSDAGVRIMRWADIPPDSRENLNRLFIERVFPVLTPLAVDSGRPFPYISNLSLNLAVLVHDPVLGRMHFARVKVPPSLPRFLPFAEQRAFVPLEDVIAANLDQLFPGMKIHEHHTFRVTRNADLEINDGAADLMEALEEELRKKRFSPAVRLEVEEGMPEHVLELLTTELELDEGHVQALPGPLDLSGLWGLYDIGPPQLKYSAYQPVTQSDLARAEDDGEMFEVIGDRDLLLHFPYEAFATSVQRFVEQAASDPDVLAIKQTLYRTSGSPIVSALIEAAERGKQVVVLVELKARFDESANITWARTLEQAGCHVVYGLAGLKTHCKLCLVVRREGERLRRYVHVGTGNYDPTTARLYEDIGLLTADEEIGEEVSHLFNYITGYSRRKEYRSLIVAPDGMREQVITLIAREAERSTDEEPGRIIMKLNNLADPAIIDALYAASQQGVKIDLLVRSICALRPGVKKLSRGITVRSILGRFLEHSRVLYFRNGGKEELYIGSADMMERNLDRRVEVLAKVKSPELGQQVKLTLELAFVDDVSSWTLQSDADWLRNDPGKANGRLSLQEQLMHDTPQNA